MTFLLLKKSFLVEPLREVSVYFQKLFSLETGDSTSLQVSRIWNLILAKLGSHLTSLTLQCVCTTSWSESKADFTMRRTILFNSCYAYNFRNLPMCYVMYLQRIIMVETIFTPSKRKARTVHWLRCVYFLCRTTHDPNQVHRQASGAAWTISYLLFWWWDIGQISSFTRKPCKGQKCTGPDDRPCHNW